MVTDYPKTIWTDESGRWTESQIFEHDVQYIRLDHVEEVLQKYRAYALELEAVTNSMTEILDAK